ncbi:MAG: hypothetical protein RIS73_1408, partial [Bacteroidota bacterium]
MQIFKTTILSFGCFFLMASWGSINKTTASSSYKNISALKFLGEYDIPYNLKYKATTVGGLSGIDYDVKHNLYYLICDDKSEKNPARFYTAKIFVTKKGIE